MHGVQLCVVISLSVYTEISDSRHGLVDRLNPVAHGKLIYDFLGDVIKVNFPPIVSTRFWNSHCALTQHISRVVEQVLRRTETSA